MTQDQFPLFDEQPDPIKGERLSPSDEFLNAHPDFVEPTIEVDDWDPNARNEERARMKGVGGGIADAIGNRLTGITGAEVVFDDQEDVSSDGLPTDAIEDNWYKQPPTVEEMRRAKAGLTSNEIEAQNALNAAQVAAIKARPTADKPKFGHGRVHQPPRF